ncbi:MAG: proton-conducting transporter membrane subunit [Cytophagaceae bacterium]
MQLIDIKTTVVVLIVLPLFSALITPFKANHRVLFYIISLCFSALYVSVLIGTEITEQPIVLTPLLVFSFDKYSWLFTFLIGICWFITIIYSSAYSKYNFQQKAEKFFTYLNVTVAVLTANGLSGNIITLFFFYILSIPLIYPLVTLKGTKDSNETGKIYIKSLLLPSLVLLIPAIVILLNCCGLINFSSEGEESYGLFRQNEFLSSIILLMFIWGFSKNSVAPFHYWLPKVSDTPAPVSALIHSVASVQTGTIALIKIGVYVFGIDYLYKLNMNFFHTGWITYLCGFTALYTGWKAYKTDDLKKRFSYSTVGQLSYIITAILIGTKASLMGAILHIVTHSFAKMCLFFVAGFFNSAYKTVKTHDIAKIAPHHRWIVAVVAIAGLSISGFPFLAGYYSKDHMLLEEIHTKHYAAAAFLLIGSIINIMYIFPIIKAGFFFKAKQDFQVQAVPIPMAIAIGICTLVTIGFSFYVYTIMRILN